MYIGTYKYILINIHIYIYIWSNEQHRCAYCGKMAYNYCTTCDEAGRGHIAVCGRRFGRDCMDKHAAGAAIIHGSQKLPTGKGPAAAATPDA